MQDPRKNLNCKNGVKIFVLDSYFQVKLGRFYERGKRDERDGEIPIFAPEFLSLFFFLQVVPMQGTALGTNTFNFSTHKAWRSHVQPTLCATSKSF
jgi:hypothetical protein